MLLSSFLIFQHSTAYIESFSKFRKRDFVVCFLGALCVNQWQINIHTGTCLKKHSSCHKCDTLKACLFVSRNVCMTFFCNVLQAKNLYRTSQSVGLRIQTVCLNTLAFCWMLHNIHGRSDEIINTKMAQRLSSGKVN